MQRASSKSQNLNFRSVSNLVAEREPVFLPLINKKGTMTLDPDSQPALMESTIASAKSTTGRKVKSELTQSLSLDKDMLGSLNSNERVLVEELAKKIDEQRKEIESRQASFLAVQRNFESVSMICKREKEENANAKQRIDLLNSEINHLREENRVLVKRVEDMIERLKKYEKYEDQELKNERGKSGRKEEVDALKLSLQEAMQNLDRKKRECAELEKQKQALNGLIEKLKGASKNEEVNQGLQLQVRDLKQELTNAQGAIKRLNELIAELRLKESNDNSKEVIAKLESEKKDLQTKMDNLLNDLNGARNELSQAKAQAQKFEQDFQAQNLQLHFANQKVEELKAQLAEKDAQIEKYKAESENYDSYVVELNYMKQLFQKYATIIEDYEKIVKSGGTPALVYQSEIDKLRNVLLQSESLRKEGNDYRNQAEKLKEDVKDKQKRIDTLYAENAILQGKLDLSQKTSQSLEDENKNLKSRIEKLSAALDVKQSHEKERSVMMTEEIETLKKRLDNKISSLDSSSSGQKELSAALEKARNQNQNLNKELEAKNTEILNLKNQLNIAQSELAMEKLNLNKQIASLEKEIKNLHEAKRGLENSGSKDLKELKNALSEAKQEVEILRKRMEEKESLINKLNTLMAEYQNEVEKAAKADSEKFKKQIEALKIENEELKTKLSKAGDVSSYTNEITSLKTQNSTLEKQVSELNSRVRELQIIKSENEKEIEKCQTNLKDRYIQYKDLESKYIELQAKMQDVDFEKLKAQIQALQKKEADLFNVISKLEHAEESLEPTISCAECMNSCKTTYTVVPCGHSFCEKCLNKDADNCPDCDKEAKAVFRNKTLDDIISKLSYNKVIFESLKKENANYKAQ